MPMITLKRRILHGFAICAGLLLCTVGAHAETVINGATLLRGGAVEGGLMIARTAPDNRVTLDDAAIPVAPDGLFIVGFHRDSDLPVTIGITKTDGTSQLTVLTPQQRSYQIQRIDGLQKNMVTPPENVIARIKSDQAAVAAARQTPAAAGDFWRGIDWPVTGRISGVFGSQRILNGQPRQPHYGIDIAVPKGTPVRAPASGLVTLVKDLYFSGWTVIINHGLGLNSTFLHLDSTAISVGDTVQRGSIIGTVGSTGRSTGPHLDWRLDWQGRRIDASLAAGPMPETG
ncbi:MAG: M23 family metallopeptidase [Candidatus Puniceispirillum sp.]|jgi:murein DD-endopeptidase MepM/ murein hydrolase activator NlpD|nr:M23 family metallopeptidase [Candidatus Puniceispirillum sp.]MBL6673663.1 M23 family metallopeptidase [Candidatus Puniceispirillum sp.]